MSLVREATGRAWKKRLTTVSLDPGSGRQAEAKIAHRARTGKPVCAFEGDMGGKLRCRPVHFRSTHTVPVPNLIRSCLPPSLKHGRLAAHTGCRGRPRNSGAGRDAGREGGNFHKVMEHESDGSKADVADSYGDAVALLGPFLYWFPLRHIGKSPQLLLCEERCSHLENGCTAAGITSRESGNARA